MVSPPIFWLTVASRSCSMSTRDHHKHVKIRANKSLWSSYNHPFIGLAMCIDSYSGHVVQRRALVWRCAIDLCVEDSCVMSYLSSQLDQVDILPQRDCNETMFWACWLEGSTCMLYSRRPVCMTVSKASVWCHWLCDAICVMPLHHPCHHNGTPSWPTCQCRGYSANTCGSTYCQVDETPQTTSSIEVMCSH